MTRWNRIRKYAVPLATIVEPFSECLTLGLAVAYCLSSHLDPRLVFSMHLVGWVCVDAAIMSGLGGPVKRVEYWMAWVFRELTAFPLYCYAMVGTRVVWRGRGYKLVFDGTVLVDDACAENEKIVGGAEGWKGEQGRQVERNESRRRKK
jgi:ceramide glucosyltransferase